MMEKCFENNVFVRKDGIENRDPKQHPIPYRQGLQT